MKITKEEKSLICIIIFIVIITIKLGREKSRTFLKTIWITMGNILKSINSVLIGIGEDGILTKLFGHVVTYFVVGIILYFLPFRKSINKRIGKIAYWLIGIVVGTILGWINTKIFY